MGEGVLSIYKPYKNQWHFKMGERCRDEKLSIFKNHWNKTELFVA